MVEIHHSMFGTMAIFVVFLSLIGSVVILKAQPKRINVPKLWRFIALLFWLSATHFILFLTADSWVDANGWLREPFFLLPQGFLLAALGGLGLIGYACHGLIRKLRNKKTST